MLSANTSLSSSRLRQSLSWMVWFVDWHPVPWTCITNPRSQHLLYEIVWNTDAITVTFTMPIILPSLPSSLTDTALMGHFVLIMSAIYWHVSNLLTFSEHVWWRPWKCGSLKNNFHTNTKSFHFLCLLGNNAGYVANRIGLLTDLSHHAQHRDTSGNCKYHLQYKLLSYIQTESSS